MQSNDIDAWEKYSTNYRIVVLKSWSLLLPLVSILAKGITVHGYHLGVFVDSLDNLVLRRVRLSLPAVCCVANVSQVESFFVGEITFRFIVS